MSHTVEVIKNSFEARFEVLLNSVSLNTASSPTVHKLINAYKILLNKDIKLKDELSKGWWSNLIISDLYNVNDMLNSRLSFDEVKSYIINIKKNRK